MKKLQKLNGRDLQGLSPTKQSIFKSGRRNWSFIASVPGDPHEFRCNICSRNLKCGHQGIADIKHHMATKGHQNVAKGMTTQSKLTFKSTPSTDNNVIKIHLRLLSIVI